MTQRPRLNLVNVAMGLTVAAAACCFWASTVQPGYNERAWFSNALWRFANNLGGSLVLAAFCTWVLALVVGLIRLHHR